MCGLHSNGLGSHACAVAEELERGPGPGALPDPERVEIPDDASALDADLWAWRSEQVRLGRRIPWQTRDRSAGWRVASRVGPMVLGSMLLVAFLFSLATTIRPAAVEQTPPGQLATVVEQDGSVGGLLPPAIVDQDGATRSVRELRPATFLLLPAAGADLAMLDAVHLQTASYGMPLVLVGPPTRAALLEQTAEDIGAGSVSVLVDRASAIAEALGLPAVSEPTVVVVGTDGRIHAIVQNPTSTIRLESVLSRATDGADPTAA